MTQPFSSEVFAAYKRGVYSALREYLGAAVRGVCLVYNDRRASTHVIVYYAGPDAPFAPGGERAAEAALAPLPAAHGLPSAPPQLVLERCDPPAPLLNRGCPIYQRGDAAWQLPPEIQQQLDAGMLRPAAG